MSIIRNVRSSTNKTVTIKRFAANQPLDTNTSGSAYPVGYIELSNYYMTPKTLSGVSYHSLHFAQNSSLIFKAEIRSGAKGPLFGSRQTNCLNIIVDDYNYEGSPVALRCILWRKGTTVIKAILASASTGIHKYGWVYGKVGSTTGMCCYYDGVLDNVQTTYFSDDLYVLRLDNSTDPMYAISDYAIRLYEIAGRLGLTASGSQSVDVHFYAVKFGTGSSYNPYMFDARSDQAIYLEPTASSTTSGRNTTKSYGSDVTYGVQLHDLKYAFSSPYNDLIAIVCQDGGNPDSGADPADVIKEIGSGTTHNMAFRLAAGVGSNVLDPQMPLPSNQFYVNRQGSYPNGLAYEYGDLICGRHPKWNIWYDGMRHSMYVKTESNSNIDYLKFNIFKDVYGNTKNEMLLRWDGYNNADTASHKPLSTLSAISGEYNDTIPCFCGSNQSIITASNTGRNVYNYDLGASGVGAVRLGNLAPWYYTRAELLNTRWAVYGAAITLQMYLGLGQAGWVDLYKQIEFGTEGTYFSSQSTTDKTKFRDNYIIPKDGRVLSDAVMRNIYDSLQWSNNQATSFARQSISLIGTPGPSMPSDSDLINCNFLMPVVSKTVTFNKYSHGDYGVCVLGDMGDSNNRGVCKFTDAHSTTEYIIAVKGRAKEIQNNLVNYLGSITTYCYCLGLPIGLYNPSTSSFMDLSGTMPIVAFLEYTVFFEGEHYVEYYGFTKPFCTYTAGSSQRTIDSPMTGTEWVGKQNMYFNTYDSIGNKSAQTVQEADADSNGRFPNSAACLFRWPDLMHYDDEQAPPQGYKGLARVRVFANLTNAPGPVAWDIYDIDSMDAPRRVIYTDTTGSTYAGYSFAFKKQNRIIPYQSSSSYNVVDGYFTIYDQNKNLKAGTSFYLPAFTIELYAMPLHNPLDITNSNMYTTSKVATINIEAEASTRTNRTGSNNGYTATVSGQIMSMSGASPEQELEYEYGSYHINISCNASSHAYAAGTMYLMKLDFNS